ncbi:MAG: methyltransferase domain-containing protein [Cyanobacteria bacterium]|nr:methyltransferase domain-containing protein [Cyanobacteriota bacterium]
MNSSLPVTQDRLFIQEAFGPDSCTFGVKNHLVDEQTPFQHVQIVDTESYGLMLILDGAVQSAEWDEYIYHEALLQPALVAHPNPQSVLILGGGEGASAREALRHRSVLKVDMVDIDPDLIDLCQKHLPTWSAGAFSDTRLQTYFMDAERFVKETQERYDVIVMDLIDEFGSNEQHAIVEGLYSKAFFQELKTKLNPGGFLVVQASEFNAGEFESFASVFREISSVFQYTEPYACFVPSFISDWGFILCHDNNQPVTGLAPDWIDNQLQMRFEPAELEQAFEFYDGLTHQKIFTLSKDIRTLIAHDFVEAPD